MHGAVLVRAHAPNFARTASGAALDRKTAATGTGEVVRVAAAFRGFVIIRPFAASDRITHLTFTHTRVADARSGLGRRVKNTGSE